MRPAAMTHSSSFAVDKEIFMKLSKVCQEVDENYNHIVVFYSNVF